MKQFLVVLLAIFSTLSFAQKKQVVIISNKYEFQKQKNSYNINNMLKAILVSNNFQVYFDDEVLPIEVAQNACDVFTGVLVDKSNMFLTKVKLQLKDCQNSLVFETSEVKSREKDIQTAYIEAIRMLSPELKKYKAVSIAIPKKEVVVEKKEIIEAPKVSEFKTFLNCTMEEIFNGFHVTEVRDSNQFLLLSMQKTKNPNIFIASRESITGVFTKTENKGIFEYYIGDNYKVEEFLF